ncbi:MAG: hypothetical protein ACLVB1_15980 [Blautia obeum]
MMTMISSMRDQEEKPKRNFSRNSQKKLTRKRIFDDERDRLQLFQHLKTAEPRPCKQDKPDGTSPRSLQCEAAERDHRQQIWKYV